MWAGGGVGIRGAENTRGRVRRTDGIATLAGDEVRDRRRTREVGRVERAGDAARKQDEALEHEGDPERIYALRHEKLRGGQ